MFLNWKLSRIWLNASTKRMYITIATAIEKKFDDLPFFWLFSATKNNFYWRWSESVYPKCHFVFLINWNMKLEIKFWFSFLYWSWDRKHQNKRFFHFQNNWTLKFKFEVCLLKQISLKNQIALKIKHQIFVSKYLPVQTPRNKH